MKADGQSRPAAIAWIRLGEVTEMLSGGTPSKARSDYWSGDIPWVSAKDMKQRRLVDAEDHITTSGLANGSKLAPANATLILVRGMTLLDDIPICSLSREVAFNQDVKAIVPKRVIEPRYLTYALLAAKPQLLSMVQEAGHGTGTLPTDRLKNLEIPLPTKSEQCAVTEILGGLDDKIELNRRMNETLEAMARAIFKSWFVDFEPVRAKIDGRWRRGQSLPGLPADLYDLFPDSFEDSELGGIPKDWGTTRLSDAFEINPPRSLSAGAVSPYLDMANMPTNSPRPLGRVDRAFTSGMKFINGDTLVARITPCLENGKTAFVDFLEDGQVGWGSTEYIVLRSKPPLPLEFSYFLARSYDFRAHAIANMSGTSGRQRVPVSCFDSYLVVVPLAPIAESFGRLVQPIMTVIKHHDEESRTLAEMRDRLLPKLISGKLRVREAGQLVKEAV
ncbi:MAG TPA: restriction endonuclease subunit S [Candidatus Binataceae bacterium]|nr:restriction endonuclease subunit S [Candidatus Binataceae bacterium]